MNLVHHLVVAELLREQLGWGSELRAPMLLGAIAPDAHSLRPGMGRAALHPERGADLAQFVVQAIAPPHSLDTGAGRAFAVGCVSHLVADELTRPNRYHLPPHAPTGFVPVPAGTTGSPSPCLDVGEIVRCLTRAEVEHWLRPLTPEMIDAKRWETLGREPLRRGAGIFLIVEPLAAVADHCVVQTQIHLKSSPVGRSLLA